jgi:trehalose/maltose hydrolase-like predicted phosphorylase
MLVGICRFFASLATFDAADDRYHINGVIGPDEFHDGYPDRPGEGINDNAYTNVLASWVFQRTLETFTVLSVHHRGGDLWERLGMSDDEIASWDTLSRRLAVPFLDNGVIAQFEGFGDLKELDWDAYRTRYSNIGRLDLILEAEGDATNCYKVTKQADVLMLLYLFDEEELDALVSYLGYELASDVIPATIDYYVARSSDGSTLSRVVHAWVLSRYDRHRSWRTFLEALGSDVADIQGGTTREGIHLGAMAGTLSLIQRFYLGTKIRHNLLWLDPHLPPHMDHLATTLHYRGHWLDVTVSDHALTVESRECDASPVSIRVLNKEHEVESGQTITIELS